MRNAPKLTPDSADSKSAAALRVLIAAHSHPQVSKGGAEIAAFNLYSALGESPKYESWFLGCVREQMNQKLGATISQPFSEREYLYSAGAFDWFKFSNKDANFPREFRALLRDLKPQILHFHHYINFGVEAFLHVRETLPECKIVLTLHEYLALCHHFGQMVTKPNRLLCYEATAIRCTNCFKDISPSDFFLRKMYIQRFLDLVDRFIAPSDFLAQRYAAWGVPRDRISVIENIIPPLIDKKVDESGEGNDILRVGFFGQISQLKGINVLFDAAANLEEWKADNIAFEIYGDYSGQPKEFQEEFLTRLAKVGRNVKLHGPYEQHRVDRLMQEVDLVLVPSIWWENSPVVIQEALRNGRPVICSDIGGMAEKVRHGLDGLHFPVGNSVALAALLQRFARDPKRLAAIATTIRPPSTVRETLDKHSQLYDSLMAQ